LSIFHGSERDWSFEDCRSAAEIVAGVCRYEITMQGFNCSFGIQFWYSIFLFEDAGIVVFFEVEICGLGNFMGIPRIGTENRVERLCCGSEGEARYGDCGR